MENGEEEMRRNGNRKLIRWSRARAAHGEKEIGDSICISERTNERRRRMHSRGQLSYDVCTERERSVRNYSMWRVFSLCNINSGRRGRGDSEYEIWRTSHVNIPSLLFDERRKWGARDMSGIRDRRCGGRCWLCEPLFPACIHGAVPV